MPSLSANFLNFREQSETNLVDLNNDEMQVDRQGYE